jgi:hypothetical protein
MSGEFPIGFQIQVGLNLSDREDVAHLRADADHARLEGAEMVPGAAVGADLLIEIADRADEELLGQELRGAPV